MFSDHVSYIPESDNIHTAILPDDIKFLLSHVLYENEYVNLKDQRKGKYSESRKTMRLMYSNFDLDSYSIVSF